MQSSTELVKENEAEVESYTGPFARVERQTQSCVMELRDCSYIYRAEYISDARGSQDNKASTAAPTLFFASCSIAFCASALEDENYNAPDQM